MLDGIASNRRVIFVCHSMGGILVRKFLVEQIHDLLDHNIEIGLFLVASPSMGSDYANWLDPLARILGHTQADALRFTQKNNWLNGLDRAFLNIKESGRLKLTGKELIEDKFVALPGLIRKQVVEPFSGARYFGDSYKVPGSNHFSIAKPGDKQSVQHRLLLAFLEKLAPPQNASKSASFEEPRSLSSTGKRIFISYRHAKPDEDLALELEKTLIADSHQVFIDHRMSVGTNWGAEIDSQLRAADIFIVLLSADSIRSDMVRQEIVLAYQLQLQGKLRILPIRVKFTGSLPYDLGSYLNPLQYAVWAGDHTTREVTEAIKRAIEQAANLPNVGQLADEQDSADQIIKLHNATERHGVPLPQVDPRILELALEKGAVRIDSQFYIRRQVDEDTERYLNQSGKTVIVKGARQMGKSSLLVRASVLSKKRGKRVCLIDFQAIDGTRLASLDSLLLYLMNRLSRDLKTARKPQDYWDDNLGGKDCATDFIEDAVLEDHNSEVILFLDEADRVFQYGYRNDFFGLLRSWTTRRAYKPEWGRFSLVIAHSTDPVLWIDDITQSPFNVGDTESLSDFTRAQLAELSHCYGLHLTDSELIYLYDLIGGQPYLSRQALYEILTKGWDTFRETASRFDGPFGDHLRRLVSIIGQRESLRKAVMQILQHKPCDDEQAFQRLYAAGVLLGESRHDGRLRCQLYKNYFRKHL